jgi:hypothetical protein
MSTQKNRGRCLLFFLVLALLSWGMYECQYQYSYWRDYQTRPWAYSKDKNAKLLVGEWQGSYTDPDGINKSISLEIFEPLSDKERRKQASRSSRRRTRGGLGSRKDTRLFEGVATVTSKLGRKIMFFTAPSAKMTSISLNYNSEQPMKPNACNPTLHSTSVNPGSGPKMP